MYTIQRCFGPGSPAACELASRTKKRKARPGDGFHLWISASYRICTQCWENAYRGKPEKNDRTVHVKDNLETKASFFVPNKAVRWLEARLHEQKERGDEPYRGAYHLEWEDTEQSHTNVFYPTKCGREKRTLVLMNSSPMSHQEIEQRLAQILDSLPAHQTPEAFYGASNGHKGSETG